MTKDKVIPCAGVVVIDIDGNIFGQLRDNKPTINVPGTATFFAGRMEEGETAEEGALRELHEETNLRLTKKDIAPLVSYVAEHTYTHEKELLQFFIAKGIDTRGLEVYEGQGSYVVKNIDDPLIASVAKQAFAMWFKERDAILNATAENPEVHRYAAALLLSPEGNMYGQLRDNKPSIDAPGKIGGFGGAVEAGETPLQAIVRELHEETNLNLGPADFEFYDRYVVWRPLTKEYEQTTVYLVRNVQPEGIEVYEGQGVRPITKADDTLAPPVVPAIKKWFAQKA